MERVRIWYMNIIYLTIHKFYASLLDNSLPYYDFNVNANCLRSVFKINDSTCLLVFFNFLHILLLRPHFIS